MALAAQGKVRDAAAEQKRFVRERVALAPEAMYLLNNKADPVLGLAAATLDAQLAAARGDTEKSLAEWRRAAGLEAALLYDEPPAWLYPVNQSLAAALLKAGQAPAAETVLRETLATHPRDGRLLFGLWQALLAQKRDSEALLVQQQYEEAWKSATVKLTLDEL
jgi:hypothetical protein